MRHLQIKLVLHEPDRVASNLAMLINFLRAYPGPRGLKTFSVSCGIHVLHWQEWKSGEILNLTENQPIAMRWAGSSVAGLDSYAFLHPLRRFQRDLLELKAAMLLPNRPTRRTAAHEVRLMALLQSTSLYIWGIGNPVPVARRTRSRLSTPLTENGKLIRNPSIFNTEGVLILRVTEVVDGRLSSDPVAVAEFKVRLEGLGDVYHWVTFGAMLTANGYAEMMTFGAIFRFYDGARVGAIPDVQVELLPHPDDLLDVMIGIVPNSMCCRFRRLALLWGDRSPRAGF